MYGLKIDCRNYHSRKPAFLTDSTLVGVEIHLIPIDFDNRSLLSTHIEKIVEDYPNLQFFSIHFPWQFTYTKELYIKHLSALEFTIKILTNASARLKPKISTIVIHCQHEFPISYYKKTDLRLRLKHKKKLLQTTNDLMCKTIELLEKARSEQAKQNNLRIALENNPTVGDNVFGYSDQCAEDILYHLDALPELMHVFDVAHIAMSMDYFKHHKDSGPLPNMEVIRAYYDGIAESLIPDLTFKNYLELVGKRITQVHISGCSGYSRQDEGIDLDAKENIVKLHSFLPFLPNEVCIIPERKQSYRDLNGDIRTLQLIKQAFSELE